MALDVDQQHGMIVHDTEDAHVREPDQDLFDPKRITHKTNRKATTSPAEAVRTDARGRGSPPSDPKKHVSSWLNPRRPPPPSTHAEAESTLQVRGFVHLNVSAHHVASRAKEHGERTHPAAQVVALIETVYRGTGPRTGGTVMAGSGNSSGRAGALNLRLGGQAFWGVCARRDASAVGPSPEATPLSLKAPAPGLSSASTT